MTGPSPIADLRFRPDKVVAMRTAFTLEQLSRRTPRLVVVSLCAALVAYWTEAPLWLPYALATISAGLAVILLATRNRAIGPVATDSDDAGWLAQELAGNGSPSGTYLLGFSAVVTIALTGVQGAFALPGWAALLLIAAWAVVNARYPVDDGSEG